MLTETYITASCCIAGETVYKNGVPVFKSDFKIGVSGFLLEVYKHFGVNYPKFYKMDNLSKLGFIAAELLLLETGISEKYDAAETGIVLSNSNASLDADLAYFESVKNIPSPAQFVYTLPNIVIGEISIRHRCKGENAFFVGAAFDAFFQQFYVQDLFNRNRLKACIGGWVECLEKDYRAVVYLVENQPEAQSLHYNIDNIHKIYELTDEQING